MFDEEIHLGIQINFGDSAHRATVASPQRMGPPLQVTLGASPGSPSLDERRLPPSTICNVLGPDVLDNSSLERYVDDVALTVQEERAIEALNVIGPFNAERVALVGSRLQDGTLLKRRIMVKVKDDHVPVPLRSLGDGAIRIFGVALALAASSGGFLLIDEVENGIHHSVQAKFWEMVLKTAQRNNVQVIATTHNADCAYRFGQVASELEDIEGNPISHPAKC